MNKLLLLLSVLFLLPSCTADVDDVLYDSVLLENTTITYSYNNINSKSINLNSVNNRLPYLFNEYVWDDFFPEDLTILDYNNDGNLDLIHANSDKHNSILGNRVRRNIKFYLGDANGNLVEDEKNKNKFIGLIHSRKSIVGDWNGDGFVDVFFAGTGPDSQQPDFTPLEYPVMLINDGDGSFIEFKLNNDYGISDGYWHSVTSSDIDNDGVAEIILVNPRGMYGSHNISRIIEFENISGNWGNGLVITKLDIPIEYSHNKFTSESIDLNNDGNIKLLLGGHNSEYGSFIYDINTKNKISIPHMGDLLIDAVFLDIDTDGDMDIIASTNTTYLEGRVEIFRNDITSFVNVTNDYISENYDYKNHNQQWIQWLYLGDFNGNGLIELHTSDSKDSDDISTTYIWELVDNKFVKIN